MKKNNQQFKITVTNAKKEVSADEVIRIGDNEFESMLMGCIKSLADIPLEEIEEQLTAESNTAEE